jgi:AcrR family transcriptional regulator
MLSTIMRENKILIEPERTKQKIFDAAIDLFATKGFKGTSIRDIATAVGMSMSNLYHHFNSKEGLLLFILEKVSDSLLPILQRVAEEQQEPLERFKSLLRVHLRWAVDHRKESKIFFLEKEELSPEGGALLKEIRQQFFDIYDYELNNLEAGGYVKGRNLKILNFNTWGVLQSYLYWYRPDGDLPFEEVSEEIVSYVVGAIVNHGASTTSHD